MNCIIDVVAAVLWRDGRFLAVKRPEGKPLAGFWEFPGGKVEDGEALGDALVRELGEELGVRPTAFESWLEERHDYDHARVKLFFYHVRAFQGAPRPREGHELRWVTPDEARALPFLEADTRVVAELGRCANTRATRA